jgi:hypothetical protein
MVESSKQLRNRWHRGTGPRIWAALGANEDLGALGVARTPEGRWDLRGIAVADVTVAAEESTTGVMTEVYDRFLDFEGATFDRIDFSYATMAHTRFTDCSVTDCVFDHADLRDLRGWRTSIRDCSFARTHMAGCSLGPWSVEEKVGDTVSSCLFDHVDLSDFYSSAGDFVVCRFLDVKMQDNQFQATIWERCEFTGTYTDVRFDGRICGVTTIPVAGPSTPWTGATSPGRGCWAATSGASTRRAWSCRPTTTSWCSTTAAG